MESALWGLLGTIAGAAASIIATIITSRNSANLQISAAGLERIEKHRAFQRETLIDLQDALHDELRAASLVFQADEEAFRNGGTWGKQLLGNELNQQAHLAGRRTLLLAERVANDSLRKHVQSVRGIVTQILMARDRSTAESGMIMMVSEGNSAMEHIGKVLRTLYSESA